MAGHFDGTGHEVFRRNDLVDVPGLLCSRRVVEAPSQNLVVGRRAGADTAASSRTKGESSIPIVVSLNPIFTGASATRTWSAGSSKSAPAAMAWPVQHTIDRDR